MKKLVLLFIILITLQSCIIIPKLDSFQMQSCVEVYCSSSEKSFVKVAGLKIIELSLSTQGVYFKLGRGFCEEYYTKRDIDYRYLYKSAYDVCRENK